MSCIWRSAVHKNYNSGTLIFFSYYPLLIFSLFFCLGHSFQAKNTINLKRYTLIKHVMEKCSVQEP